LYVSASQGLYRVTDTFLGRPAEKVPYLIAVAGSVAVGKSTTARIMAGLLARWPNHPRVSLVPTDGFLLSNAELERRGLMQRKGFPESFDTRRLLDFLEALKSGQPEVAAPVYSHHAYDVVPDERLVVENADIVILEGLNVLQRAVRRKQMVSDYIDFGVYVDAAQKHVRKWYVERFLTLRDSAFRDPDAYFHKYAALTDEQAVQTAESIWDAINGPNLKHNIYPTRVRADLILRKGADHSVEDVKLRRL
jgi:type I pantothenate kinase